MVSAVLEPEKAEVSQNATERLLDSFRGMGVVVAVNRHHRALALLSEFFTFSHGEAHEMDPVSLRVRQPWPRRPHIVQDSGLLWIIRDGPYVGTGEHEFRADRYLRLCNTLPVPASYPCGRYVGTPLVKAVARWS